MIRTVRVMVSGGAVQEVRCPRGVRVVVRDYDVAPGAEGLHCDLRGDLYEEAEYRHSPRRIRRRRKRA